MTTIRKLGFAALALCTIAAMPAKAATIAYVVPTDTVGSQAYTGVLGMDFVVNSAIDVISLGAFDDYNSGRYGIRGTTLVTELWSRNGNSSGTKLATQTFSQGSEGALIGSSRFKDLSDILKLAVGEYSIVSYGYDGNNKNGNIPISWSTNDGGGVLSFIGGGRYGGPLGSTIGNTLDGGPENRYAAGTFAYNVSVVPLPAALPLYGAGLAVMGFVGWRRKQKSVTTA